MSDVRVDEDPSGYFRVEVLGADSDLLATANLPPEVFNECRCSNLLIATFIDRISSHVTRYDSSALTKQAHYEEVRRAIEGFNPDDETVIDRINEDDSTDDDTELV